MKSFKKYQILFFLLLVALTFQNCGGSGLNGASSASLSDNEVYNGHIQKLLSESGFLLIDKDALGESLDGQIFEVNPLIQAEITNVNANQVFYMRVLEAGVISPNYTTYARLKVNNETKIVKGVLDQNNDGFASLHLLDLGAFNLSDVQSLQFYVFKISDNSASLAQITDQAFKDLNALLESDVFCGNSETSERPTSCLEMHSTCDAASNSLGLINSQTNLNLCEPLSCKKGFALRNGKCKAIEKTCHQEARGIGVVFSGQTKCTALKCNSPLDILSKGECLPANTNDFTDSKGTGVAEFDEKTGKYVITKYTSCKKAYVLYKSQCQRKSQVVNTKIGKAVRSFNVKSGKFELTYKECIDEYYLHNAKCIAKESNIIELSTLEIWNFNKPNCPAHFFRNKITKKCHRPLNAKICTKASLQKYQKANYYGHIRKSFGKERYIEIFNNKLKRPKDLVLSVNNHSSITFCKK